MIGILLFFIFIMLIFDRLFFPWHYIDGKGMYNILGKNKYGENKEQRIIRYKKTIKELQRTMK
jgi:hypothetical protein